MTQAIFLNLYRGSILSIIGLMILFSLACSNAANTSGGVATRHTPPANFNEGLNVSRDEAVRIATDFSKSDYTMDAYEAIVFENETSWTVNFVFKQKYGNRVGGGPAVEVDKKTGEILRHYFSR